MLPIRKILVPVDFSSCSRSALEHAVWLADEIGASIDVLHVWPGETARVVDPGEGEPPSALNELNAFVASVKQPQRGRLSQRLETGSPPRRILEDAGTGSYDLLVLGTHGRTGRLHMIMGSVAEEVVRGAPCPVLTVRGPD